MMMSFFRITGKKSVLKELIFIEILSLESNEELFQGNSERGKCGRCLSYETFNEIP
jgi:hypothetical protein